MKAYLERQYSKLMNMPSEDRKAIAKRLILILSWAVPICLCAGSFFGRQREKRRAAGYRSMFFASGAFLAGRYWLLYLHRKRKNARFAELGETPTARENRFAGVLHAMQARMKQRRRRVFPALRYRHEIEAEYREMKKDTARTREGSAPPRKKLFPLIKNDMPASPFYEYAAGEEDRAADAAGIYSNVV